MRINLYQQNRHVLIIDGVAVIGFKEGDWMQVKIEGNAATRTKGGDGPSMNLSTPQGGQLTFGINPTSPALGTMYALRAQQPANPRLFSVQLLTGVNETISAAGCGWGELPQFATGGEKQQGRDFLIECTTITPDYSAIEALDGGLINGLI
jgi:hypothetical protein